MLTKSLAGKADKTRCRLIADWQLTNDDKGRIKAATTKLEQYNELSTSLYFAQQKSMK